MLVHIAIYLYMFTTFISLVGHMYFSACLLHAKKGQEKEKNKYDPFDYAFMHMQMLGS